MTYLLSPLTRSPTGPNAGTAALKVQLEIKELLGAGSEAIVLRADDDATGAQYTLKILHPQWHTAPAVVAQFRDGAAAHARVRSRFVPRFVGYADQGPHGPCVVLKYVRGRTLKAWSEGCAGSCAPPGLFEVVRYGCATARGLCDTHAAGVTHGDVKPSNVLLPESGQAAALLTDFGQARGPGAPAPAGFVGTPAFAAPEIHAGASVTPAADLYSLGVTLYYAAVGPGAAGALRTGATVWQARTDIGPAPGARSRALVALSALIEELTSADPGARPSAAETVRRLECLRERLRGAR